tara:strand:- start:1211 stop:2761 length:1551 start_codon:yes stop_codon:yes gene_type:complete
MTYFTKSLQSFLIFSIPFLLFLKPQNYFEIINLEILYLFSLLIILFISSFLLSKILKIIFRNKLRNTDIYDLTFVFGIIFFEIFYHEKIRSIISNFFGIERVSTYFFSFLLIFIINIITFFLLSKFINKLKPTILIFMILLIIVTYAKNLTLFQNIFFSKSEVIIFNKSDLPNKGLKQNIYLIILDEMASLDLFTREFPEEKNNMEDFEKKLIAKKFYIVDESFSAFNLTYLNLTALINANYFIDENTKRYLSRNSFFPNSIFYKRENSLQVLDYLKKNNNFLRVIGNSEMDFKLASNDKNLKLDNSSILLPNIFYKFFEPTFIDEIFRRTVQNYLVKTNESIFLKNNAMLSLQLDLENNLKKNSKGLYFVHHFSPHAPYLYDKNCNNRLDYHKDANPREYNSNLYKEAYICVTKQILFLIDKIRKIDKDPIIIFQGDTSFTQDRTKIDRFKIFNAISLPKRCEKNLNNKMSNINIFRLALYCSSNEEPIFYENKSFIGFHGDEKDYGYIKRIKLN